MVHFILKTETTLYFLYYNNLKYKIYVFNISWYISRYRIINIINSKEHQFSCDIMTFDEIFILANVKNKTIQIEKIN